MRYFRRSEHAVLLTAISLVSYGIGGLIYWIVKKDQRVCPSCGTSWERAREIRPGDRLRGGEERPSHALRASAVGSEPVPGGPVPVRPPALQGLPGSGLFRRVFGAGLAIAAAVLVVVAFVSRDLSVLALSGTLGLAGASSFAWGLAALQQRRQRLLQALQGRVLHLARGKSGRLTATDVAADLDMTLPAAERVLFSMDDGFRVRSDVTNDGLLVFDFPEIMMRHLPRGENLGVGARSSAS